MSSGDHPLRYAARVTIEFTTPFIIGAGDPDLFSDAVFVADANGLPALPGSSIAGVLRHELTASINNGSSMSKDIIDDLFGFQEKDAGKGSRLRVSWGCIHDSRNIPVEGIADPARLDGEVLNKARYAMQRDHVCITHKGTAKKQGKFDERSVTAGHRFT